ncbi:hypothetical protein JAAARDRAFT_70590 [Jaapia argillacea MUCL 33604]|uniref:DUF1479-domain-containing protein n=1 Tax=Jaapia argillacea MUCL 33604 TaxID=933084 RepID=A0A067PYA5_9AGAM|nr:hypothetical protein JAAARDRAFT_70590 [Jaapia argillacea MUCL 33604]
MSSSTITISPGSLEATNGSGHGAPAGAASTGRSPKASITNVISSFQSNSPAAEPFPARFSALKKQIWKDGLVETWRQVLAELEGAVEEIKEKGSEIIPRVSFSDIQRGLSHDQLQALRRTGVIVVQGGIPKEEALGWKRSIQEYAAANKDLLKGFPPNNIQMFEIYNSRSQLLARTHPSVLQTQIFLNSLWRTSDPNSPISLSTPVSYFDRLRIRQPDAASEKGRFVLNGLSPHIDGGSIERWEDEGFRKCWDKVLAGGSKWKEFDPFDATPRLEANQDLYNAPNQCSVFRTWQGWTSLSTTGPTEGTLRVLPNLSLATAYIILRPFFRSTSPTSLKADDWVVDLENPTFPGSKITMTQALSNDTHPHLRLNDSIVSIPKVEPGDQVYWHCDLVHAVEAEHLGKGDSSVVYIPAAPLTTRNVEYLQAQRENLMKGYPPPDFPSDEGEARFRSRGTPGDVSTEEGRRLLGLSPFIIPDGATEGAKRVIEEANKMLF